MNDPEYMDPYGAQNHPLPGNNPKTWGEMTDAEKVDLLLAHHKGKVIEYYSTLYGKWRIPDLSVVSWHNCNAYRVRPEPSHLPLKAGNYYLTSNDQTWECVFVRDDMAYMTNHGGPAYIWDADTGKAISLTNEYDVVGVLK